MNDFDKAARYAAKVDPVGFLHWLLAELDPSLTYKDWLDTRRLPLPGDRNRTNDCVAALDNAAEPDRPWAIVIEFQTAPESAMLLRLLDYSARLLSELRSHAEKGKMWHVAAAVVNLTGPVQVDTLDMRLPGKHDFGLRFRAVVRTLREEDAGLTLKTILDGTTAPCVLPWIPLMRGGGEGGIIKL